MTARTTTAVMIARTTTAMMIARTTTAVMIARTITPHMPLKDCAVVSKGPSPRAGSIIKVRPTAAALRRAQAEPGGIKTTDYDYV
jgi:hypothetical protein